MILTFQGGTNTTKISLEGKSISISSQKTGFRFVPINPFLNKEELEELNSAKDENELVSIMEKEMLNAGYKLVSRVE